ncbi:NADP-dependent oxidoreductase [Sphingomonas sp.]|uniref:NADP-dependent oxidoreductase n=1 Tax=Sphingomonas sp. TaxID=28214 RepID=UPI003AFFDABD
MARAWHLIRRPQGLPDPGCFALRDVEPAPLGDGEVRIANRLLSVDPYMRGRMDDRKSYVPPFALDAPMEGGAVGEVVESRSDALPVGALAFHMAGWRDEAVVSARDARAIPADTGLPDGMWLGVLGLTGLTAWFGLLDVAQAREGDIVFVSAAAGAVGSNVVQIAKARGMRVIGSAGGEEKCAWLRSIGADATIDYKAVGDDFGRALRDAAPKGIDVYFDNVGGSQLDAALACARPHARFASCGMIDVYNDARPTILRAAPQIIVSRIRIAGFNAVDYLGRMDEFVAGMMPLVADGRVVSRETVTEGLDAMPGAFLGLFRGDNVGKALVRI